MGRGNKELEDAIVHSTNRVLEVPGEIGDTGNAEGAEP